jgi:hypothetical protein
MTSPPSWRSSPYTSPPEWPLQTEHRLTKAEGRLDQHQGQHERQHLWNRGFAVALLSLGSAVAHSKADNLAEVLVWLAQNLLR